MWGGEAEFWGGGGWISGVEREDAGIGRAVRRSMVIEKPKA